MQFDTQFAKCDGIAVAYQTFGTGPDLMKSWLASPATSTVRELCAGSGLTFLDRGWRTLAGLPEPWRVFAVS